MISPEPGERRLPVWLTGEDPPRTPPRRRFAPHRRARDFLHGRLRPGFGAGAVATRIRPHRLSFGAVPPLSLLPLMIGPLGMQEMLIILVVALIVFGPRKLPQIGKTLGKSMAEFRRTSNELKSTLEREVQMEEFREARRQVSEVGEDLSGAVRGGLDRDAASRKNPAWGGGAGTAGASGSAAAESPPAAGSGAGGGGAPESGPPRGGGSGGSAAPGGRNDPEGSASDDAASGGGASAPAGGDS